ncbi:uncharacterized protein LOC111380604 [Olea europaea var. sylvestris]|uniref:uncharacterized protein LOC111380604 n=1 Tax=Olea europaea var. sylvestris TaxID=158386 RepID=UPI000C1D8219|nr:uncharacterized protein LOC111380604 [Olea europaea var. sylvestris]
MRSVKRPSRPEKASRTGPLLSKPKLDDILQLYLVVSNEATSSVLIQEEGITQLPMYYTSKAFLYPETHYPNMEKLALALITASTKLRPYFQAHTIHVLTKFPLRTAIKGQALADFVTEFTNIPEVEEVMEPVEPPKLNMFVDGSAGDRFGSWGSPGLKFAKEMHVRRLHINSDFQLVVSQMNESFSARDKTMVSYLKMVMNLLLSFEKFKIMQIPLLENAHADALSKLTSSKDSELLAIVPIEHLITPSTEASEDHVLPTDKDEAYKLRRRSAHFLFIDDVLYKRSFSSPLLRSVGRDEATYILREIHESICGNHSGGLALAQKRQPSQELNVISNLWPFSKWDVDLIGPLPKGRGGANFSIVAIDYFTKWIEAELLAKIIEVNTSKFFWKNIICRFRILHSIVSDNGRQFDNKKVRNLCAELGIKKHLSTPRHPQANGQVEVVNKTIKHVLKRKLDASKGAWVDDLPQVLWVI